MPIIALAWQSWFTLFKSLAYLRTFARHEKKSLPKFFLQIWSKFSNEVIMSVIGLSPVLATELCVGVFCDRSFCFVISAKETPNLTLPLLAENLFWRVAFLLFFATASDLIFASRDCRIGHSSLLVAVYAFKNVIRFFGDLARYGIFNLNHGGFMDTRRDMTLLRAMCSPTLTTPVWHTTAPWGVSWPLAIVALG